MIIDLHQPGIEKIQNYLTGYRRQYARNDAEQQKFAKLAGSQKADPRSQSAHQCAFVDALIQRGVDSSKQHRKPGKQRKNQQ